ncbi:MAG: hypothetical protein WCQ60_01325 [bacterium]
MNPSRKWKTAIPATMPVLVSAVIVATPKGGKVETVGYEEKDYELNKARQRIGVED